MAKEIIDSSVYQSETGVQGQYRNWFLDYASYVILERAVPAIEDGLKPVQRRILHAMKEMDDGRFNKVANIIGQAMQYHPHGDASIGDALVNLGQKDLLIDTQGNWGDIRTGDSAAAPRYIEARLSKFALDVAFNAKTTEWQVSYDGRKREPVTLPMKFPLLLAQGVEGIAVGLATKVMPHNFREIIEASVNYLKGLPFQLYPDFQTGGLVDVSNYQDGKRGGKVKVRCVIEELDKKSLIIRDVPFGVTVGQLCESITKANDQGKIKIKKLTEFTGKNVEVQVDLAPGISSDITIDALYAFTDCEVSISPNACIIEAQKPKFVGTYELLTMSVDKTKTLLEMELRIKLAELNDKWHYTSLEKIFFEKKIYKELEQKHETWETVVMAIEKAFVPYQKLLKRQVTREDVLKLTEKPVRRIYKLDIEELNNQIKGIDAEIAKTTHDLAHLNDFAIAYFLELLAKYGKGRERKTEIKVFDTISVQQVAMANTKLYVDREEGFIGTALKKAELLFECSDLDDIIIFNKKGTMRVVRVGEKVFVGKDILHIAIFKRNDERTTYNMIYSYGATGVTYAKRFNVTGITRDKEYHLAKEDDKSKVLYFSANPNGEAEKVKVLLTPTAKARTKEFDFTFEDIEIKSRSSLGNTVTKYPVKTVKFKEAGRSTLAGRKLWFDDKFGRLSTEEKGMYLGSFESDDRLVTLYSDGNYELTDTELAQRFDPDKVLLMERFDAAKVFTAVYLDHAKNQYYVKRFKIETTTLKTKYLVIKEGDGNRLETVTTVAEPVLTVFNRSNGTSSKFNISDMVEVMGWKAFGAKLMNYNESLEMEWEALPKDDNPMPELF